MYGEAVGLLRQRRAMSVLLSSGSFFFSPSFFPVVLHSIVVVKGFDMRHLLRNFTLNP